MYSLLLSALLLTASGCQKCEEGPDTNSQSCAADKQAVKTVANVEGTIGYEPTLRQYFIRRFIPGTIDSVDYGLLCGTVPANLQVVGARVLFSGAYKPYDKQPPAGPAGQEYYYLELSSVKVI